MQCYETDKETDSEKDKKKETREEGKKGREESIPEKELISN